MRKLVVLLALSVLSVGAAPADAATPSCFPRGATRETANKVARVYSVEDPDIGTVYYGCFKASGRTTLLGSVDLAEFVDVDYIADIRLKGRFVAFDDGCICRDYHAVPDGISVVDLRRGQIVHRAEFPREGSIDDVVVSPSGSAALIVTQSKTREVRTIEGRAAYGTSRVVDTGLDIAPDSLALRGATLIWKHDGKRRTARLR
jgi:hypothetical protein